MGIIIFVTLFFAFSLTLLLSSMLNLLTFLFRGNLLSLDLCYNYISNLKETVTTLALLPKLRNLLLKGNPVFVSRVRYLIHLMYLIGTRKLFLDQLRDVKPVARVALKFC